MKVDPYVLYYGLFSFGLRLEHAFSHLFIDEHTGEFEEMLLHHSVTIFLFGGYLASNSLAFGTMIVILHDSSDILFHWAKAVNASNLSDDGAIAPFLLGQVVFAYARLYAFPRIIYGIWSNSFPEERVEFNHWLTLNVVFLSILCCMHVLWMAMMIRIDLQVINKEKVKPEEIIIATETTDEKQLSPHMFGRSPSGESTCSADSSDGPRSPTSPAPEVKNFKVE